MFWYSVGLAVAGCAIAMMRLPAMAPRERARRALGIFILSVLAYVSVWLLLGTVSAAVGSAAVLRGGDIPREAVGNVISMVAAAFAIAAAAGLVRSDRSAGRSDYPPPTPEDASRE